MEEPNRGGIYSLVNALIKILEGLWPLELAKNLGHISRRLNVYGFSTVLSLNAYAILQKGLAMYTCISQWGVSSHINPMSSYDKHFCGFVHRLVCLNS